jgi:hypothetical protein
MVQSGKVLLLVEFRVSVEPSRSTMAHDLDKLDTKLSFLPSFLLSLVDFHI